MFGLTINVGVCTHVYTSFQAIGSVLNKELVSSTDRRFL